MSKFDRNSNQYKPIDSNTSHLLTIIFNSLKNEWISECQDLCKIIQNPHLRAILYAADCVARNDYFPSLPTEDTITQSSDNCDPNAYPSFKIVQVVKNDEPLGATVKVEEKSGAVVMARVLVGGAAHRSGLIQVGDQVLEVNGISVRGRSPIDIIGLLERECKNGVIHFKLLAADYDIHSDHSKQTNFMVRAHFDYEPKTDPYIPCGEIGLSFKKGNILNVVNREDPNWWQACKFSDSVNKSFSLFSRAGLIPGKQLQERRFVAMRDLKSQYDSDRYIEIIPGCKSPFRKAIWTPRKVKKIMYDVCENLNFDREEITTYEPVAKYYPRPHTFRPIVLIGPFGVGRKTLIRLLMEVRPNHFRRPIAHTTRFKRFTENDGIEYFFVSDEWMEKEIKCGNFIEYGEFKGNYYGIHKETVHQIIDSGFVCLMNPNCQALKLVYNSEFKPYVIFIRPTYDLNRLIESRTDKNSKKLSQKSIENEFHAMIFEAHKLNYLYGHYFDTTLINDDLKESLRKLLEIIKSVETEPKWVPAGWAHSNQLS
jgi:guanylate kinase